MTQPSTIPDPETRKREVERLRESNRQLEQVNLALDELIAMVEADLRRQRRERLDGKYRRVEQIGQRCCKHKLGSFVPNQNWLPC